MKKLRHLLRRSGFMTSEKRRQRRPDAARTGGRRLRNETLEKRQLLAGDIALAHNYWHAADVDDNQEITAGDALRVINLLQRNNGAFEVTEAGQIDSFADVNADGMVSAADALSVINSLNRGEAAGELVDIRLNARDINDDPLTTDANREINVEVGEIFYLEVSYSDLRTFGTGIGAFQLSTDILFDQPNVITPIFTETQFLIVEDTIRSATTGSLTFSLEGQAGSFVSSLNDFANDPEAEIANALVALGFNADEFEVSTLAPNLVLFPGQPTSPEPDPGNPSFSIRFTDFARANEDLPNLVVTNDLNADVETRVLESPPVINGELNGAAAGDNLDTRSRSAPGVDPFGRVVYGSRTFGTFDPVTGFDELGALGPAVGGGIPDAVGSFPEPFDAYSIPIQINQPVTGLTISLDPAENNEAVLLYGRDDGGLPQELVLIDSILGSITVNATGVATGLVAGDTAQTLDEDADPITIDLTTLTTINSGGAATFGVVTNGTLGNATINGNILTYTPTADEFGSDSIVYSATNNDGTDTGTISLTINSVNDDPVAVDDSGVTDRGQAVTIDVLANDSFGPANENQTLTITNVGNPTNGTATATAGGIQYTPNIDFFGNDSFTYTISDGVTTSQATVNVTVNEVSIGPSASDGTLNTTEDQTTAVTLDLSTLVVINSGDAASISLTTLPTLGTASLNGTILSYIPDPNNFGTDSLIYTATNNVASDAATITINIAPVNDPPVAVDDTLNGTEDTLATINVLTNDNAGPGESDTLFVQSVADGANGTTSINSAGNIEYLPNPDFFGSDSFTYVLSDGDLTATGTVSVTIAAVNDPPVAGDDTVTTLEDTPVTISVLDNDNAGAANETDTLTVSAGTDPSNGSVVINANNTITYTPDANFFGSDSFTYTLSDGVESTTATVQVTVTADNDPPVAIDDSATTPENNSVEISVLANDNAGPGESDTLTVVDNTNPSNGSVAFNNGVATYTPNTNFVGSDSFSYTISDGSLTASATVNITVTDVIPPPVAADSSASVDEDGGPITIDLASLVTVDAGDTFSLAITTLPGRGSASLVGDTLTYTPAADEFGADSLIYTATNSVGSDTGTINITINPINDPPVLSLTSGSTLLNNSVQFDVLAQATTGAANEADTLTIVDVSDPANGTTEFNGVITYTPDLDFVGTDTFTYTISDGTDTTTATFTVEVNDFAASSISGSLFFDNLENIEEFSQDPLNVHPIRNGMHDSDETGLGGAPIYLMSPATDNVTGQEIDIKVLTDLSGGYRFDGVAPGTYWVSYNIPETLIFGNTIAGSPEASPVSRGVMQVVIGPSGGVNANNLNFSLYGMQNSSLGYIDILASTYLNNNTPVDQLSGSGREGGTVSLDGLGNQNFFKPLEGFEGVRFAELALNETRDAALLTVINQDYSVGSALLGEMHFIASPDGQAVRIFGGIDDFDFDFPTSDPMAVRDEFASYRNSIDEALKDMAR